jgi:hypothetical protein
LGKIGNGEMMNNIFLLNKDGDVVARSKVDDDDYEVYGHLAWSLDSKGYAKHLFGEYPNYKMKKLHRLIMNAPDNMQVDHINGDKLDNRKCNLRLCNNSQNQMNRGKQKNNTSGYIGVTWRSDLRKWRAQLFINKKHIQLGYFDNPVDAALAYNSGAIQYHGEFARLNEVEKR